MPESELGGAKELVDGFIARLQYTQGGSKDGQGKRPLMRGQHQIRGSDVLGERSPKKRCGRPQKQTRGW